MKSILFFRLTNLPVLFFGFCFACGIVCGQESGDEEKLHSQFVAGIFHDIAYEILNRHKVTDQQIEEAMVFLAAAAELDGQSSCINETIVNASSHVSDDKYDEWIQLAFERYCDGDADLVVSGRAIQHFLDCADSAGKQKEILSHLLGKVSDRNLMLNSELSTRLGFLLAGKGGADSTTEASLSYFRKAVQYDPYNLPAFMGLYKLFDAAGETMLPSMYARHLRFSMRANPIDIDSVLQFAQYANSAGMHDISTQAYEYWIKLHHYLNGDSAFDRSVFVPWSYSNYCSKDSQLKCLEILKIARDQGVFDVMLESIAAMATVKMSNRELGEQILSSVEKRINSFKTKSSDVSDVDGAIFYNFILPDPSKALAWAQRAAFNDPNSADARALLGFALASDYVSNKNDKSKLDQAREILEEKQGKGKSKAFGPSLYQVNQSAAVGMGVIELLEGDSKKATEILQSAVRMSEHSFVADKAKEILKELSSEYKSIDDSDQIVDSLEQSFPGGIVPEFVRTEDIISAKLAMSNTEISFGTEPEVKLLVLNKWSEPLVIFDKGIFKGNIRVDAEVRGDIKTNIYELISKKIRPGAPVNPGGYLSVALNVMTGNLRRILHEYPQASVEVIFTVYLDPVVDQNGNAASSVIGVGPIAKVYPGGVRVDDKYLTRSMEELSKGRFKQKIRAGQLFNGLFSEQYSVTGAKGKYRYATVERSLLTSAIRKNIADEDWMVRVAGMSNLLDLSPPVDFEITKGASANLNDSRWPVRMAALYMLSRTQGNEFIPVLKWKSENDPDLNVRGLAEVLLERK